jgi:hypothetical protein
MNRIIKREGSLVSQQIQARATENGLFPHFGEGKSLDGLVSWPLLSDLRAISGGMSRQIS